MPRRDSKAHRLPGSIYPDSTINPLRCGPTADMASIPTLHSTFYRCRYWLELYSGPQFLEVPAYPDFSSTPLRLSTHSAAYQCRNGRTLPVCAHCGFNGYSIQAFAILFHLPLSSLTGTHSISAQIRLCALFRVAQSTYRVSQHEYRMDSIGRDFTFPRSTYAAPAQLRARGFGRYTTVDIPSRGASAPRCLGWLAEFEGG